MPGGGLTPKGVSAVDRKQMALILGRHRSSFVLQSSPASQSYQAMEISAGDDVSGTGAGAALNLDEEEVATLNDLIGNTGLSERFLSVALAMGVTEPKTAEGELNSSIHRFLYSFPLLVSFTRFLSSLTHTLTHSLTPSLTLSTYRHLQDTPR